MNSISRIISLTALIATIASCLLFYSGAIGHEPTKWISLIATIAWFIATPMWMGREKRVSDTAVEI